MAIVRCRSKRGRVTIAFVTGCTDPSGETNLAAVGALLAVSARAKILLALVDGRSLPANLLAAEAGVGASTASHHLTRLAEAGMITVATHGRHRYFTLAGPSAAELIEAVARMAPVQPITSLREGTRAHAVRYARRCYDHLAGRLGVAIAEGLQEEGALDACDGAGFTVTERGARTLAGLGIDAHPGEIARACLDWTEQRNHLAGRLGRALMTRLLEAGWLKCDTRSRALHLTDEGRAWMSAQLRISPP